MINKIKMILLLTVLQLCANAQQKYTLDVKKSKILWKVETIGKHAGNILFNSGFLSFSIKNEPISGSFSLNMKSMHSTADATAEKNQRVDGELKTPVFFDVANYPTATINVKKITVTANPAIFKINADVTIKGITNPVEFTAAIKKYGDLVSAYAQLAIDRRNWNIDYKPKQTDIFDSMKDKFIANDIQVTLKLIFKKEAL